MSGSAEARSHRFECWRRSVPLQFVDRLKQVDVCSERRQISKQKGAVALSLERQGELRRARDVHMPVVPVSRDGLEVDKSCEHGRGRLGAPAWQARKTVGGIA